MKKLVLAVVLTALLLIVGQAAQAEPYQLPVRVHTLVACNQGALALTYTGEVFYIAGDNAAVVQITPRFFEGELVYLEGICSGANGTFYAIAYGDDEPIICQATLEEEALVLSPLGKVAMGDGNFRLFDLMADRTGVLMRVSNETYYWNIATSKMEQLIGMDYRLMASGGGIIVALHSNNGKEELVRVDVAAQSSAAIRVLSQMPGQLAVSPDGQVVAWCVDSLVTAGRENTEQLLQGYMAGMDTRKDFPCCVTIDGRFYYANADAVSCVQLVE